MRKAFIVCGSPGSGKTTYARELAKKQTAAILDIDSMADRLVRCGLRVAGRDEADRDSLYYKQIYREPIYSTMFDVAKDNLAWIDVVIVGPFTKEIRNSAWPDELRKDLQCDVELHYVYCDSKTRYERLRKRGSERDAAKVAQWDKYIQYYGSELPPSFPHIAVKTDR